MCILYQNRQFQSLHFFQYFTLPVSNHLDFSFLENISKTNFLAKTYKTPSNQNRVLNFLGPNIFHIVHFWISEPFPVFIFGVYLGNS